MQSFIASSQLGRKTYFIATSQLGSFSKASKSAREVLYIRKLTDLPQSEVLSDDVVRELVKPGVVVRGLHGKLTHQVIVRPLFGKKRKRYACLSTDGFSTA